jgi:hypothetical protein
MRASRRLHFIAIALTILGAMNVGANAATNVRSLGVSLTIVASCVITTPDSSEGLAAAAETADVDCSHAMPFSIVVEPITTLSKATEDEPALMTVFY